MKKEDFTGMVVYLLMIAIAVIFGFTVLKEYAGVSGMGNLFMLFVLGGIVVGIILSALVIEFGHIVGAKVSGYDIELVTILGFCFYKNEGKRKFKFSEFDGLTGETKIRLKKDGKDNPNPVPYLLFGPLFLFVLLMASIVLFITFNKLAGAQRGGDLARTAYFVLIIGVIGAMVLIYNIFPAQLDTTNDGYRFALVSNPTNREAFNEQLRVQRAIENGEENVEIKTFDTITNYTADLNLNKVYAALDKNDYDAAIPYLTKIIEAKDNIKFSIYLRVKALYIYSVVMPQEEKDIVEYCNKEVSLQDRKALAADISMPSLRAYILLSGLVDKSESETLLVLNKIIKAYKKSSKSRQLVELRLYNKALNKVIEAHPKWDLKGYLLEDK